MGKMLTPDAGIYVGSHVHIPEEDARLDYDGRISFVAPSDTPRRKSVTISLRTIMVISLIAAAVLFIMAQYALAQRRAVINEGRRIASEIVSAENNIESMKKKIADSDRIGTDAEAEETAELVAASIDQKAFDGITGR